ncbi:MAG: NAD(P)H-hydrate dehydratase, partial [Flavobacteriales bacterium]|nr:NAD(P)H-hydrate dehydratase [Flavobacteriales bacterium]
KATTTLSLELPKLAFLFAENEDFVGQWIIIPIGLDQEFIVTQDSKFNYTGQVETCNLIKRRPAFGHKGTFGHALVCGGSKGMIGAAVLMSRSCLRSGVGLVTTVVPRCGYAILQEAVPESMCRNLKEEDILSGETELDGYSAVGIGPGIGRHPRTASWLKQVLKEVEVPLVVDADALNIIADNPELLGLIPKGSILTPHPGEFDRLDSKSSSGFERAEKQSKFAIKHEVYVVLKGRNTSIATPDGHVHFNGSGNAGMATGGSGDVLTGLITGLLAQGYNSFEACLVAVYIHGLAGDLQAAKHSEQALIAGDIVRGIGEAFQQMKKR